MGKQADRRVAQVHRLCGLKRAFDSWDEADAEAMRLWREQPREKDVNPAAPYICLVEPSHYHIGHIKFGQNAAPGFRGRRRWRKERKRRGTT